MYHWSSPPMWSMGTAHRDDELKTMSYYYAPGPGTYDQVDDGTYKQQNPAWRQGTSTRPPLYSSNNPGTGPGSYEAPEKIGKLETNKDGKVPASFAKAKRGHSELKGVTTVGPGSYNPKKFAKAYPQFSFGYKGEGIYSNTRAHTPGPGAYDTKDPFDIADQSQKPGGDKTAFLRTAPQAFSQAKESAFGDHSTPGPGQNYNPNIDNYSFRYFTPNYTFGTSTRDDLYNSEAKNFPGPGKYNFAGGIKTKSGYTILGRHPTKGNSSDTPAPNVYNQSINPLRKTAPSFRIGQAERKNLAMGSADVPGPGQYERQNQLSSKGARIGTSTRPPLYAIDGQKNPGPGQYKVAGETGNTFKYSMGVKPQSKKVSEVMPGPGEYDPFESSTMERNNGAIIGTSERPPLYKKAGAPGPGQYDVRGDIGGGHKAKIGKGRRAPLAKVNDEPGPGFYNIPSAIGNIPKYLQPGFAQERRKAAAADKETSFRGMFG